MQDNEYNDRRRLFFIELYEDTNSYDFNEVLRILKSYKYYAYIKHMPEGESLKAHYHFYLRLDNAMTCNALSKKTGIPVNYLGKPVKSERSCLRYLTHIDEEDKIIYKFEDIICSKCFEKTVAMAYDDLLTDYEIMEKIFEYLDSFKGCSYGYVIKNLLLWCNNNAYDKVYKKYRFEFDNYLKNVL